MSDMRINEDDFGGRGQEGGNTGSQGGNTMERDRVTRGEIGEEETDTETGGEIDEDATEESGL
ncbi:MAG: hypothetical protein ABR584_05940 [Candidatus Baltobacteraceae bacterium]